MSRTIAVVTSSRADWGHVVWPLHALRERAKAEGGAVKLIVMGAHLASEFGESVNEIERAGFEVDERVECLLSSDTDVGMAKTIGVSVLGLSEVLSRMRPDLLLVIADRYEMLAPSSVACALRIPIAHIEGGEVSEGAIDHVVRNALTMMSHIHLVPTALAAKRVEAMGEEPWRITRTGAPSLDHLMKSDAAHTRRARAHTGRRSAGRLSGRRAPPGDGRARDGAGSRGGLRCAGASRSTVDPVLPECRRGRSRDRLAATRCCANHASMRTCS